MKKPKHNQKGDGEMSIFDKEELNKKTEIQLIRLYRNSTDQKEKSKIFNMYLFKRFGTYSWHERVLFCVNKNKQRLNYYGCFYTEQDLYQEITCAMTKALEKWIDIESESACSAYMTRVINSYCNRIFQSEKTYKRKMNTNSIIEINDLHGGSEKKYHEVISNHNGVGVIKTSNKIQSFEKTLVYRDLFDFLNKLFKQEAVNAPKQLQNQLITFIKEKRKDHELHQIAESFKFDFQYVLKIKNILEENIEKQIYHDILIIMKKDLKGDDIIMNKYDCSKGYIIKIKQKFSNIAEKKLKAMGISIKDYLSE